MAQITFWAAKKYHNKYENPELSAQEEVTIDILSLKEIQGRLRETVLRGTRELHNLD